MDALNDAILVAQDGAETRARELWQDRPCVVVVLRRPGCVLCRAEAQKVWQRRAELLPARLVCVVHEWRPAEIKAFTEEGFWPGPVYHDVSKAFYSFVGGGQPFVGSALGLLNPFGAVWGRIREASKTVKSHNVVGEGLVMGGMVVVPAGGREAVFTHLERDLGVHADFADVVEATKRAAALSEKQLAVGGMQADEGVANATAILTQ